MCFSSFLADVTGSWGTWQDGPMSTYGVLLACRLSHTGAVSVAVARLRSCHIWLSGL